MRRAIVLLLLAVACDSPTIPGRDVASVFPFELPTDPPAVLRWPVGHTVRVHVAPGRDDATTQALREAFRRGADAWNAVAVFAEYHLVEAERLETADVVLTWSDVIPPVETGQCRPAITQAVTTFCVDNFGTDSVRLRVFPPRDGGAPGNVRMLVTILATEVANVDRLVAHELGHVLGISQHSEDPRDLMWRTDPQPFGPTRRDAATVQVLYHTRADIVP